MDGRREEKLEVDEQSKSSSWSVMGPFFDGLDGFNPRIYGRAYDYVRADYSMSLLRTP
jgi:hypothetical protein